MLIYPLIIALAHAAATYSHYPDMMVVNVEPRKGLPTSLDLFIPDHEPRTPLSVLMKPRGLSHSYTIADKTYNFNCKVAYFDPGRECHCSMEARDRDSLTLIGNSDCTGETYRRDSRGMCYIIFHPDSGTFGSCETKPLREQPSNPALEEKEWPWKQTFFVPRQPVSWSARIRSQRVAIKCGMEDTCDCSMISLPDIHWGDGYMSCPFDKPSKRDAEGNCHVSFDYKDKPDPSYSDISCRTEASDENKL